MDKTKIFILACLFLLLSLAGFLIFRKHRRIRIKSFRHTAILARYLHPLFHLQLAIKPAKQIPVIIHIILLFPNMMIIMKIRKRIK
jgi:hypothetical protein